MILAGDVGGTKTTLALFAQGPNEALVQVRSQTWASAHFSSLEAICDAFLAETAPHTVHHACFGVPGAVVAGECRTTNLPWVIRERDLSTHLNIPHVSLLNDLQVAAYGMLYLDPADFRVLQHGSNASPLRERPSNIAVIAAGTGLGEALLVWTGKEHVPVASEGGHATFAPRNALELALRDFVAEQLGAPDAHVSWERVASGLGLSNLYTFLRKRGLHPESPRVANLLGGGADLGSVVGSEAVAGTDPLCVASAQLFASLFGAEASNLALKGLTTGGVVVGGGIPPKILSVLERGEFMESFLHKGRFRTLLSTIPVMVSMNDKAPIIGAAHWAARAHL